MPRPITYDPSVTVGNMGTFVWSINTIDYVKDGEGVTEDITNRPWIEPVYGLIDHTQFLYLRSNAEITRVNNLFTKLGVANTGTEHSWGPPYNYLTGTLNFLEAFQAIDAAVFGIASTQGTDSAKVNNIAARLGTGYGTDPDLPVFAGAAVTASLILANDRTHTAIEKVANQAQTNKTNITTLTTKEANLLANLGTGFDSTHVPGTLPAYGADPAAVVDDGDTVLEAITALANEGKAQEDKITNIRAVVGLSGATTPPITYQSINSQSAFAIGQSALSSNNTDPHHEVLILLDNMLEGSLRHEEGREEFLMSNWKTLEVARAPVTTYFEIFNFLSVKHDPINTTVALSRRKRRCQATAPNQKWVSPTIVLTGTPGLVKIVPVLAPGTTIDTNFEIWANATNSLLTGSSVRIFEADFNTWVTLPATGANGRVFVNFPNTTGQLLGLRIMFGVD